MCGLCGEIDFQGHAATLDAVERMVDALAPRGPDDVGMLHRGPVAFGHRRLSIIDRSRRAEQPMTDPALGLSIVYNGAIYNHVELRHELEARGYAFFSRGDTEVVLKAYHAWGSDCVHRLRGMFAFAIHERDSQRTFLARDRLGIKPLYYVDAPQKFRFASTLPALLAAGDVDTAIDPVALHHYLTFHGVVPAPRTILRGVRKLPPGAWMRIEADGRKHQETYWSLRMGPLAGDERRTFEEWQHELHDVLEHAVTGRLVADVPVGVLLSGGLDSSLIVALLAKAGQADLQTFSIGFESIDRECGDEFHYSRLVAREFGTKHHELMIPAADVLAHLGPCVRAMSEPMVSHDNIGFYLLSREVAKHVRVVQSGQGADEVFGGYHWYPPLLAHAHGDDVDAYARVFFDRDHQEFGELVQDAWMTHDHSREFVRNAFAAGEGATTIDKALRIDTCTMLVDDPVKRVDNMTMAFGLEARVPFLDHEVVEVAARMPAEHKVGHGGKHVLKCLARSLLPAEVIDRPKGYFPVPALKYLRGPYLEYVRSALDQPVARDRGLLRRETIASWLDSPDDHLTRLRGSKLWQVALLELWLQQHT